MDLLPAGDAAIESDREEIDGLDSAVIDLLRRRMRVSHRIQQRRNSEGGPRTVLSREMAILNHYRTDLGAPGTAIAMNILELCRGAVPQPGTDVEGLSVVPLQEETA